MTRKIALIVSLLVATVIVLIKSFIFMLLWNWIIVKIFGMPYLDYLSALGILIIVNLLLNSFQS